MTAAVVASTIAFSESLRAESMLFDEVSKRAGLTVQHVNGMRGELWLAEVMGAGVGVLDFNGDARLDIWVIQSGWLHSDNPPAQRDRLFLNVSRNGELRFVDITEDSGVQASQYGMGIATGDIDNDGDLDVFLANYGVNQLFENVGDGTFRDITTAAGMRGSNWSAAGSFFDFDGDGWLDLYVANYVDFNLANHKQCLGIGHQPNYCWPRSYRPQSDRLYRNLGNRTFQDVSRDAGIHGAFGGALGVVAEDFDNDGTLDLYVANDPDKNLLWINQGDGTFVDQAMQRGVAVNGDGESEAGMGIAAKDFDGDCDVDLFVTNLTAETNTLYVNNGKGRFVDATNRLGLGVSSTPFTGFGTAWVDFDNDSDLDLFSSNGAVSLISAQQMAGDNHPLRQTNQMWELDAGRYVERQLDVFNYADVSRGAAFADLDNDGDTDILVTNNAGHLRLFENQQRSNHWLGIALSKPGHATTGSSIRLASKPCSMGRSRTDGSYASASDERVIFGLGNRKEAVHVVVVWADGTEITYGPLEVDRYHLLTSDHRSTP